MRSSDARSLTVRLGTALLLCAALLATGCSSDPELTVDVTSTAQTNGGRPFYAVIRSVKQATYVTDSYEGIAARVMANPPDKSILKADVIYPGVPVEWTVPQPKADSVGIYFLFTSPGDGWKLIRTPPLPSDLDITLGISNVTSAK